MKWSDRVSLLWTFCGSFLLFWIVYGLISFSAALMVSNPEGTPSLFFRLVEFLARTGAALTGSTKQDTALFRAATLYSFIFAVVRTIRARRKMLNVNDQSDHHKNH